MYLESLASAIFFILMSAAAIFTNVLLVVLILLRDYTRKRAINLQIMHLSATTCLSVLVQLITTVWIWPGYHMCRMLNFLGIWSSCLLGLILLLINVDRFLALLFPKIYSKLANKWYAAMMLAGPQIVTFVIYMGLVLGGEEVTNGDDFRGLCFIPLKQDIARIVIILGFVVPMIIVFLLGGTTIATYAIKRRKISTESPEDIPEGRTRALLTLGLVDGLYIVMWLPINVLILKMYFCTEDQMMCHDYNLLHTEWLGYANLVITPLLWAIHRDIGRAFETFCCCICQRHSANSGGHDNIALTSPDVTETNGRQK